LVQGPLLRLFSTFVGSAVRVIPVAATKVEPQLRFAQDARAPDVITNRQRRLVEPRAHLSRRLQTGAALIRREPLYFIPPLQTQTRVCIEILFFWDNLFWRELILFIDVIILLVGLAVKEETKSRLNCCFPCKDGHFNEKIKTLGVEFGAAFVSYARVILLKKAASPRQLNVLASSCKMRREGVEKRVSKV
jgi:hypothetical protein